MHGVGMWPLKNLISKIPVWESRVSFADWVWRVVRMLVLLLISSWVTFMAWLDGVVQPWGLGRLGYVAVFLLVALCCSLILMILARATYYFRGGSRRQNMKEEKVGGITRSVTTTAGLTRHDKFRPHGLYIGNIDIDHRFINERRMLTILVSGFNASGCSIDIREVRGSISARVKNLVYTPTATFKDALDFGDMLSPSISRWIHELSNIESLSEFSFKIIQNVPANMLDEINATHWERRIAVDFTKLDVMVYPAAHSDPEACRLPLWSGATFHLSSAEWMKVHKVVSANPPPAGAQGVAGLGSG